MNARFATILRATMSSELIDTRPGPNAGRSIDPTKPAPSPEPQDVWEALGYDWISEAATRITNRLAHEGWIACESYVRDDVHGVCQEEIAALAQSSPPQDAQPIERARYHLQAADHALHDIEGDPLVDYAHTLNEALRFLDKIEHEASAQYATLAARKICDVLEALAPAVDVLEALAPAVAAGEWRVGLIEAAEWHDAQADNLRKQRDGATFPAYYQSDIATHTECARVMRERSRAADRSAPRSDKGGA